MPLNWLVACTWLAVSPRRRARKNFVGTKACISPPEIELELDQAISKVSLGHASSAARPSAALEGLTLPVNNMQITHPTTSEEWKGQSTTKTSQQHTSAPTSQPIAQAQPCQAEGLAISTAPPKVILESGHIWCVHSPVSCPCSRCCEACSWANGKSTMP